MVECRVVLIVSCAILYSPETTQPSSQPVQTQPPPPAAISAPAAAPPSHPPAQPQPQPHPSSQPPHDAAETGNVGRREKGEERHRQQGQARGDYHSERRSDHRGGDSARGEGRGNRGRCASEDKLFQACIEATSLTHHMTRSPKISSAGTHFRLGI